MKLPETMSPASSLAPDEVLALIDAALAGHEHIANPRHGCCAPPTLCKGHAPECRGRRHPLGGVREPCADATALRAARELLLGPPRA